MDSIVSLLRLLLEIVRAIFDYRNKRKARRENDGQISP